MEDEAKAQELNDKAEDVLTRCTFVLTRTNPPGAAGMNCQPVTLYVADINATTTIFGLFRKIHAHCQAIVMPRNDDDGPTKSKVIGLSLPSWRRYFWSP
jgi:hypothetical protein